jgi:3-oxoacyl-(acyl-carrier-protein) synthase
VNVLPARAGVGNCGAGSQALDLVAAVMMLQQQLVPPALNSPDPIGGLTISAQPVKRDITYAMVLGSALSGQNSAIVLKRV